MLKVQISSNFKILLWVSGTNHLLTLAPCWLDFRQKITLRSFSIYLQTEDAFFICTVICILVQIYKFGFIANPRQLNDVKLIYI